MNAVDMRDELMMAYAAGRVPEPVALLMATHVALCPTAAKAVRGYEAIGGALLEGIAPEPMAADALSRMMSRLDDPDPVVERRSSPAGRDDPAIPAPLRPYLPGPLSSLEWHRYGPVSEAEILTEAPGYRTRLLRIKAGKAVVKHTHEGNELTVVLCGAFRDGDARYVRGDLAIADHHVDHQPMAEDGEDCLCLAVTDAPLKLTGRFTRFLNPFVRI